MSAVTKVLGEPGLFLASVLCNGRIKKKNCSGHFGVIVKILNYSGTD